MFSGIITRGLVKNNRFRFTVYRRFSEVNENLVKLFRNLKDAQNPGELHKFSLDLDKYQELRAFTALNSEKSLGLPEESESSRCVDEGFNLTSSPHSGSENVSYAQNRDLILDSFTNTLRLSSTNYNLVSFLSDSIGSFLHELDFSQIYRLVNFILGMELKNSPTDDKVYSLLQKLLNRVNFLITERISYTKGIVKVNQLPKYSQVRLENSLDPRLGIDLKSNDHLEKLWNIWYKLSRKYQAESKYTISLLMSLLEMETRKIFEFDLLRVLMVLDTLVGDCKSFSKLDERVILRLLKRFVGIMGQMSEEMDPNTFIKSNNVTPVQIKKFICNISKISKVSHHVLAETFKLKNSYSAFEKFIKISGEVIRNELEKMGMTNESENGTNQLSDFYSKTREEVVSKYNKLYLKIFCDSVDILKFLDYMTLEENRHHHESPRLEDSSEPSGLKTELITLCTQILSKVNPKSEDLMVSECRSMYYLVLTSLVCGSEKETLSGFTKSELMKAVSTKIINNTNKLIETIESASEIGNRDSEKVESGLNKSTKNNFRDYFKNSEGVTKSVQYLLYCDKISNILKKFKNGHELEEKVHLASRKLAETLSLIYESVLRPAESHWLKTLYVTLMNKYQLMSVEMYSEFIGGLENWEKWKGKEISMLCDLFSRTHGELSDKEMTLNTHSFPEKRPPTSPKGSIIMVMEKVSNTLKSLVKYLFLDGNSGKLGNRDFISVITPVNLYKDHLEIFKKHELPDQVEGESGVGVDDGYNDGVPSGTDVTDHSQYQSEFECGSGSQYKPNKLEELVIGDLKQRLNDMNFSQLVKLLQVFRSNTPYTDLRNEILEAISKLDHLGDLSCLVDLNDPEVTRRVLNLFEIKLVDENYTNFEKLIKFKFLNRFGNRKPCSSYTTNQDYQTLLKQTA